MRRATTLDKIAVAAILLYAVLQLVSLYWRPVANLVPLGLLALAAFGYLCIRLMPWIRSRLLWGLRNRLIVTYIFIGMIPVLLLLAMVGIGLYLLYPQIGAHLLVDALQDRMGIIAVDADEIVSALVQEIQKDDSPTDPSLLTRPRVASLVQAAKAEWPGLRVVLQHQPRLSNSGNFRGLTEFRGELNFASEQRRQSATASTVLTVSSPSSAAGPTLTPVIATLVAFSLSDSVAGALALPASATGWTVIAVEAVPCVAEVLLPSVDVTVTFSVSEPSYSVVAV
jgi:hypothetical protein